MTNITVTFPRTIKQADLLARVSGRGTLSEGDNYAGMTWRLNATAKQDQIELIQAVRDMKNNTLTLTKRQANLMLQLVCIRGVDSWTTLTAADEKNFPYIVALVQAGITKFPTKKELYY